MSTLGRSAARSPVLFSDEDSERENRINLKPIIKSLKRLDPATQSPPLSGLSAKATGRRKRDRANSTGSNESQNSGKRRRDSDRSTSDAGIMEVTNNARGDTAPQSATDEPSEVDSDGSHSVVLPVTPARTFPKPGLRYRPPNDFTSFALSVSADHITVEDTLAKGCELWLLEAPTDVDIDVLGGLELALDDRHRRLTEPDIAGGVYLEAICSRWSERNVDATVLLPSRHSETQLQSAHVPAGLVQIVKAVDAKDDMPEVKRAKRSREKRPLPDGLKIRYRPIGCTGSASSGVAPLTKKKKDRKKKKHANRKSC